MNEQKSLIKVEDTPVSLPGWGGGIPQFWFHDQDDGASKTRYPKGLTEFRYSHMEIICP